jgi:hypothetical protein
LRPWHHRADIAAGTVYRTFRPKAIFVTELIAGM